MQVEPVRPADVVDDVGRLLAAAWKLPSVHYSPAYLRWQFTFPGPLEPAGIAAFAEGRMIGFVAVVNRRLRLAESTRDVYLCSFLGVDPEFRGTVAFGLMREITRVCREKGAPAVAFAIPGGHGERITIGAFEAAEFHHVPLNLCQAYGGAPRVALDPAAVANPAGDEELVRVFATDRPPTFLASEPTPDQRLHYASDPRGSTWVSVADTSGTIVGAALVVCSELVTKEGLQRIASIDGVRLVNPDPAQLAAVVRFAAARWPDRVTTPLVVASNLGGVHRDVIRAAGLRELPSAPAFRGHLFLPDPADPLAAARVTNLEVV